MKQLGLLLLSILLFVSCKREDKHSPESHQVDNQPEAKAEVKNRFET